MDLAEQALEMVQHSWQQRRQQAAVQVPAVMTSQAYQKMLCHRSYRSQESSKQQARVGLDRHKTVNPKVLFRYHHWQERW